MLVAFMLATSWPSELLAQRAAPRSSAPRSGVAVPRPPYSGGYYRPYRPYYYPRYYYPYFYGGFYTPFYWGAYWGPYWGGGYPYYYGGPYYGYGPYYYDNSGSARLQISPREAQVYVDGYFAGIVDNFDGNLQRLNVESGEHELQFHLQGYRPFSIKVLFVRGRTVKITHAMEPLAPGEPQSTPPKPPQPDPSTRPQQYGTARPEYGPSRPDQMPPSRAGRPSDFGSLLLRVRPSDATVLVDGEPWTAPQGEDQFVIELTDGPHRVEVRKDGFQTYSTTVRVRRGDTVRLNVSLTTGGSISGF
jgi:hypothetical protein